MLPNAMISSDLNPTLETHKRNNVRRQRYQKGSLQMRTSAKGKKWVLLYRDEKGSKRFKTLGSCSKLSKSQAEKKRDEILSEVNVRDSAPDVDITLGDFIERVALPFCRTNWKKSTAGTTENRIRHHLVKDLGNTQLRQLKLTTLQRYLQGKAANRSKSIVAHLRWDLQVIFRVARSEGYITGDPTEALVIPRDSTVREGRAMTKEEVGKYITALELRERLIGHLAIFAGMRPGEILALQRKHIAEDCMEIEIDQRVYRGEIDTPKTNSSRRKVAIAPQTAALLQRWMELVQPKPTAWVFASENPQKPMWRDNVWYRHMKPHLDKVGLGWANFQVMRRTHASLGHDAGIDPKVAADQRGHGIGVSLDTYTKTSIGKKAEAAERLENAVLNS